MSILTRSFKSNYLKVISLVILIVCLTALHFSFTKVETNQQQMANEYFDSFIECVNQLNAASIQFKDDKLSLDQLQKEVLETRKAYKKIEFIIEYRYPSFAEEHINGAPLLHIEKTESGAYILTPEGLQTIDEMVFSGEDFEKNALFELTQMLMNEANLLASGFHAKPILKMDLIESIRLELVRIFTLGLTGFDTPGSLNALEESRVAFGSMFEFLKPNLSEDQTIRIAPIFDKAQQMFKQNKDFESFDRLTFLVEVIEPLYQELNNVQSGMHDDRLVKNAMGWNSKSAHIFSDDFLNPYQYTALTESQNSVELKELGQKFFFDASLSSNGKISCASCHNPNLAYTDGQAKSLSSVEGKTVARNAPTLMNAVYSDRYFYDLRAFSLEQQAEHVIYNHMEFNTSYNEIVDKINQNSNYTATVKELFGSKEINRETYSRALASYVMSLRSFNSPFDQYVRGELEELDQDVKDGFNLFMGKANCGTCHFAPTFAGLVPPFYRKNESEILGVLKDPKSDEPELDDDFGRNHNRVVSESSWIYDRSFKTSTVRNVELSGPYFHNGAYSSLEEVVEFYNNGGGLGYGLEVKNQTLSGDSLHLNEAEQKALIAFMQSLTDNPFTY